MQQVQKRYVLPENRNHASVFSDYNLNQTISTISHVLLAMMCYPDAFKKANEEIVRVIGTERLPTFDDRASLPYGMCPKFYGIF